ncbi:MAG: CheR family methyltransferase [bacterium]
MINFFGSQLERFRDVVFETSGLWFSDEKLPILSNRLQQRMKACGISDPLKYMDMLSSPDDRAELANLINLVTTNETYFYRCEAQMNRFCHDVLGEIVKTKTAKNERKLRIWSAGCSTGEEPYTISICINENLPFHRIWDIYVYATDISTQVLANAFEARYKGRSVAQLPMELLKKYFDEKEGYYLVKDSVKRYVDFEYMNLLDAVYEKDFDVIFCRNVLIYFRDETKADILKKFHDSLVEGGYLFLGPSEMVRGLVDGFRMKVFKDAVVFQKEPE